MSVLVIIDAFATNAAKVAAKTIAAAVKLDAPIEALLVGPYAAEVADSIAGQPVQKIYSCKADEMVFPSAEQLTALVLEQFKDYSCYLTAATTTGKDFLPRLAMKLGAQPVTDIIEVLSPTQFKRSIYAGNVMVTVECDQSVKCLSVRPTSFTPLADGDSKAEIVEVSTGLPEALVAYEQPEAEDTEVVDITSANIVISAGNGIGTKEKFAKVEELAKKIGAGVGASRALVDAGVVANEYQVGQTGKVVAPEMYIALGISGAIQHIAGMKDSGTIIAINRDEEAPIFAISDYILVADLDAVLPELLDAF